MISPRSDINNPSPLSPSVMKLKAFLKDFFKLLLVISFPIHIWSFFQIFNNFEWIANRTNLNDAIGYFAYALMFALFDSLIISILVILIYLPLKSSRGQNKAHGIFTSVYFISTAWLIFYRVKIAQTRDGEFIWHFIQEIGDTYSLRLRYEYGLLFFYAAMIALTLILPVFLINKYHKAEKIVQTLIERVELLAYIYIFLDVVGILTVIFRNI
jgi:hypothetical protein